MTCGLGRIPLRANTVPGMDNKLCQSCTAEVVRRRGAPVRSLMSCRGDGHRMPLLCPHRHGFMPLTPDGESMVCRARTGCDPQGRSACCRETLGRTVCGRDGKPLRGIHGHRYDHPEGSELGQGSPGKTLSEFTEPGSSPSTGTPLRQAHRPRGFPAPSGPGTEAAGASPGRFRPEKSGLRLFIR